MTTASAERKYALSKVAPGDYVLPSNDAQTIWRLVRYTDGPSNGLDTPRDRDYWSVYRWTGRTGVGAFIDTSSDAWDRWEYREGMLETRGDAIGAALNAS